MSKIIKISLEIFSIFLILFINQIELKAENQHALPGIFTETVRLEPAFPQLSFAFPVDLQVAPDNSNRIFVVEQPGKIQVFRNDESISQVDVFLDIEESVDFGGEKGLLGLAFHPDYATNGYFFVNYTARNPLRTIVSRFRVSATDSNRADPASEFILLEIPQPYSNHNAGQLAFGPDGYLYIATGDGGSAGDPQGNAQNLRNLLGAILRIDVNQSEGSLNYTIPPDNPLVGNQAGFREEIWAWGLRNPWRFSFDAETGQLWAGDVGQSRIEEINIVEKGKNYGWKIMEGSLCYQPTTDCDTSGLTLPVWEYSHTNGDLSIIGGYVYRGRNIPELVGKYIYADYVSGRIWVFKNGTDPENELLLNSNLSITAFGTDSTGELYLLTASGEIYRFNPLTNQVPETNQPVVNFDLRQNYPNPFNGTTLIRFSLPNSQSVQLDIFNYQGRRVRQLLTGFRTGDVAIRWDGRDDAGRLVASGSYFYRLQVAGEMIQKKMIFLK